MRSINLSTHVLSEALWTRVFENAAPRYLESLDQLRGQAQYKTGSISTATQWLLFSMSYLWQPQVAVEIGTYIGKSALAIALGADAAGQTMEIHTCDMSNHFDLPTISRAKVIQYQGSASTQMLSELVEDGYESRVQFFHVDGRLSKEDVALLMRLSSNDAIVALDDFEGVEKGVANLFNLRAAGAFVDHVAFYPPPERLIRELGFWDRSTTGLLVPRQCIRFTAQ